MQFSLCFVKENKVIYKENLALYQKSLRAFIQAPLQLSLRLDFAAKMASSQGGTSPCDLLQGLAPSWLLTLKTDSSHWLILKSWRLHCNLDHDWLIDYKLYASLWPTVNLTLLTRDLIGWVNTAYAVYFNTYLHCGQLGACNKKESWVNRNFPGLARLRKFWFDHCIVWYKPSSALDFTRP